MNGVLNMGGRLVNGPDRGSGQILAPPSVQQVLLEQSGGQPLSIQEAEHINSKLNQIDACIY